jgi:hypothetical protein
MDTIAPLPSVLPIGSATSQGRERSHGQQLPETGKVFKAEVLEAMGNNRFVLEIGGNRLTATSEAQLAVGQVLQLQVTKTEPQIQLKIINDTLNHFAGRSLTLLGKSIDLTALMAAAEKLSPQPLPLLTPTSRNVLESFFSLQQHTLGDKDGGAVLKHLVENLGLNLEHLLAKGDKEAAVQTLKAALLEIAHSFGSAEQLAKVTHKILATLELFQFAQIQTGSESQVIFPLPLPFVEQGYLTIDRQDDGKDSNQSEALESRFSLHLTMSELGNLRIDFLHNLEGLFIRFHMDTQEKADFIASFGDELKAAVTDSPLIGLSFSGDATDPINDLIRQLVPEGRSMLDTKA